MTNLVTHGLYDDYADEIRREFDNHKRIILKAPTGTGKTFLLKRLAVEYNAVILVPTLDMISLYESSDIVSVRTDSLDCYTSSKPVVLIWDALVRLPAALRDDALSRAWFADEPHAWFDDRRYRDSAVKTMNLAKKVERLLCVSATPSGEIEELGLHLLEYATERSKISTKIATTDNVERYLSTVIANARIRGLKTAVLTDQYAVSLYGCHKYVYGDTDVQLLHTRERSTPDFHDTVYYNGERDKSMFRAQTTLCTRLVEMGLNFYNEEPMVMVVHLNLGEHTANKVVQFVGRLRKCDGIELVVVVDTSYKGGDVLQRSLDGYILDNAGMEPALRSEVRSRIDGLLSGDSADKVDALVHIRNYTKSHSTLGAIVADLDSEGYFDIKSVGYESADCDCECYDDYREKSFREMLEIGKYNNLDDKQLEWLNKIDALSASGFDFKRWLFSGHTQGKRIDALLLDAQTIVRVSVFKGRKADFEREFDYELLKHINPRLSIRIYKEMQTIFKRCYALFGLLERCESVDDYYNMCVESAEDDMERVKAIRAQNCRRTGAANKKRISVRNKFNHEVSIYESREDAMKWLKCSKRTLAKFLSGEVTKLNRVYEIVDNGLSSALF